MDAGLGLYEIASLTAPMVSKEVHACLRKTATRGLALFRDRADLHLFEIPGDIPETVAIGSHFFVMPLLGWLAEPRDFLILE